MKNAVQHTTLILFACLALSGCKNDLRIECRSDDGCELGEICTFDICVAEDVDASGDVGDPDADVANDVEADPDSASEDVDATTDPADSDDVDTRSDVAETCIPSAEICNGIDDDCDGDVDTNDADLVAGLCPLQLGVCAGSVYETCVSGMPTGGCDAETYDAQTSAAFDLDIELHCDGFDNNCDGVVDELCERTISVGEPPPFASAVDVVDDPETILTTLRDDGSLWVIAARTIDGTREVLWHEFTVASTHPRATISLGEFDGFDGIELAGEMHLFLVDDGVLNSCSLSQFADACVLQALPAVGDTVSSATVFAWGEDAVIQASSELGLQTFLLDGGDLSLSLVDIEIPAGLRAADRSQQLLFTESNDTLEMVRTDDLLSVIVETHALSEVTFDGGDIQIIGERVLVSALVGATVEVHEFDLTGTALDLDEFEVDPLGDFWGATSSFNQELVILARRPTADGTSRITIEQLESELRGLEILSASDRTLPSTLVANGDSLYVVVIAGSRTRNVFALQAIPMAPEFVLLDVPPAE